MYIYCIFIKYTTITHNQKPVYVLAAVHTFKESTKDFFQKKKTGKYKEERDPPSNYKMDERNL